ncbi:ABC transporter permease [Spirulina major CS-329]|uniref:ABC transporter permease n=1 Tax=Spirulina TaxID=1154 RepID=UPI0023310BFB|nr:MULTISPECIES: ABC transporter permease [Spirulina]MDB9495818.1 ABC transporter permease [Spirulina subsalsa CS-330]MDB9505461.1 ABC transporter permease [Spirulina major CS-329]
MSELLRMLIAQLRIEFLSLIRNWVFIISIITISTAPILVNSLSPSENESVFLFFGLLISILIFIDKLGLEIANERLQGWTKLLRVTPLPPGIYIIAKVLTTNALSIVLFYTLLGLEWFKHGEIGYPLSWWILKFTLILLGLIPFEILFFAVGYTLNPKSSGATISIFLLVSFLGVVPLPNLPNIIRDFLPLSPFFHYSDLLFNNQAQPVLHKLVDIGWLLWTAIVGFAWAIWAYRREKALD